MTECYKLNIKRVFEELKTKKTGLSENEAKARLVRDGHNKLEEGKKISVFTLFIEQFKSLLIWILIFAVAFSGATGHVIDALIILFILILNAVLGVVQEYKAQKAIEALKKMSSPVASVIRDGERVEIKSEELVEGDVIILDTGDKVPADCRIIEESNLHVDESMLTGESVPVTKSTTALKKDLLVSDRKNMVYMGTNITQGNARAIVTETGMKTEMGKIASKIERKEQTPLQERLDSLGKKIGIIVIGISIAVLIVGYFRGLDLMLMILTAISLAVAAVPEGLPAIVTISLALGIQRMSKRNAIVRRLSGVETLGRVNVICSDKTGTLTENHMTVKKVYVNGKLVDAGKIKKRDEIVLEVGAVCNNSIVQNGEVIGEPTENALIEIADKYKVAYSHKRLKENPFDSTRKMMSTINVKNGNKMVFAKGAVEVILDKCTHVCKNGRIVKLTKKERENIIRSNIKMTRNALRVLAMAFKQNVNGKNESGLIFAGMQGMIDPPRKDVIKAIKVAKMAGIETVMITGDHELTARAIAREIGIDDTNSVTGEELEAMNDAEFYKKVKNITVYARVSPDHKLRIVETMKNKGYIVAMTGDGVNDAPALNKAHIGVSMGITGTDVAREASDMVLTDDNYATIVNAVEEGRTIYDNIKKTVKYLLACNVGEVLTILTALLINLPLPLLPLQILWMNLVTDVMPALALGVDPAEKGIMKRKPIREDILSKKTFAYILLVGIFMTIAALLLFTGELGAGLGKARTMSFTTLVVVQMFIAFSARSEKSVLNRGLFTNKKLWLTIIASVGLQIAIVQFGVLGSIFKTVPLLLSDWGIIFGVCFTVFIVAEGIKKIVMKQN